MSSKGSMTLNLQVEGRVLSDILYVLARSEPGQVKIVPPKPPDGPTHNGPVPVPMNGARFEIAEDYALVVDKQAKKTYAVKVLNAHLALQAMVEQGIDKAHKQTSEFICKEVSTLRSKSSKGLIAPQALIHLFRQPHATLSTRPLDPDTR